MPAYEYQSATPIGGGYYRDQYGNVAFGAGPQGAATHPFEYESVAPRADGTFADQYGNPWTPPTAEAGRSLTDAVRYQNDPQSLPPGFTSAGDDPLTGKPLLRDAQGRIWADGGAPPGASAESVIGPGGTAYGIKSEQDAYGRQQNKAGGIQGFLDGPGPVALLGAGVLGAGLMGAGQFAGGVSGGGLSIGNAPGIGGYTAFTGAAETGAAGAGYAAADAAAVTQMGIDAGLSGSALDSFVASGGTLGSTAAGGLGGASSLAESFGLETPAYTPPTYGPVDPSFPQLPPTPPSPPGGSEIPPPPPPPGGTPVEGNYSTAPGTSQTYDTTSTTTQLPGYGADAAKAANALQRIIDGTATAADYASVLGGIGATGLGVLGSNANQSAFKDVYNQQMALGAPSRARYEASFAPGFSVYDDPATKDAATRSADIAARSYSAKSGNPFDNPGAQSGIYQNVFAGVGLPQLNTYRSQNLTGGQLGTNTAGTASLTGAGQTGQVFDALGGGLGLLTQPDNDLASLMKKYGLNLGTRPV